MGRSKDTVTLRGLLKRRGFSLCASYAGMRREPHARGRCHNADYVGDAEFPTILVADVDRADAVAVPDEPARLVGELEAHAASRPLVNLLVARVTNIIALPDNAHIPDDQRLHACLLQRGDKSRGLLMLDIPNLVLDLLELPLLGADDALASLGTLLHAPVQ
jgi:hypothetical protein